MSSIVEETVSSHVLCRISFDGRFSGSSYGSSIGKEKSEDTASNAKAGALCVIKKSHAGKTMIYLIV